MLEAQDEIVRKFVKEKYEILTQTPLLSWEFNLIEPHTRGLFIFLFKHYYLFFNGN